MKKLMVMTTLALCPFVAYSKGGGTSASNRSGKHFDVSLQLIGFIIFPVPAQGLAVGYYLSSDTEIELEYTTGSLSFSDKADYVDPEQNKRTSDTVVTSTTYGAKLKYFLGNSFYTNLGIISRKIALDDTSTYVVDGEVIYEDEKLYFSVTSLALDISIGNKWQFDNFNIGCDWFGALVPISVISTEDNFEEKLGTDNKAVEDFKSSNKSNGMTTSYQMLKIYVGSSF